MKRNIFVLATPVVLLFACLFAMTTSSAEDTSKAVDNNVTFTKDVAPIFYKNCTACHRPGEVAPMSLLTYKDARPWAKAIREKVVEKQMPPWHADPQHGEWLNDRQLIRSRNGWMAAPGKANRKTFHPRRNILKAGVSASRIKRSQFPSRQCPPMALLVISI